MKTPPKKGDLAFGFYSKKKKPIQKTVAKDFGRFSQDDIDAFEYVGGVRFESKPENIRKSTIRNRSRKLMNKVQEKLAAENASKLETLLSSVMLQFIKRAIKE